MKFRRFRRLRSNKNLRGLFEHYPLSMGDIIYPLFVVSGNNKKEPIPFMDKNYKMSIDNILKECEELCALKISAVLLFGIPDDKDLLGSNALRDDFVLIDAIKSIKRNFPNIAVLSDVCFCSFTEHGHCGILDDKNIVDNDKTLEALAKQAVIHAQAGCDMVAPSGMMDGVVVSMREALDKEGFVNIPIMNYSTKFSSSYYGPFREASASKPSFGDRNGYQVSYLNKKEAIYESIEDEIEGADVLMVKPSLVYMDIINQISNRVNLPLAAYNTSGEYAMIKVACKAGILDYEDTIIETMSGLKRAGADIIITYHAKDLSRILKKRFC